ncbi:MAG: type II toxin-antitoxin system VapC family toxin [Pseudonocardiaceae bacterium]
MILVDTSVWVEHLRAGRPDLVRLLEWGLVLGHPWVAGELALGHLVRRSEVIGLLGALPRAIVATPDEILTLVEHHQLHGVGIGYVDAQLLASTVLTDGATLWTADRRLEVAAFRVGCARV